MELFLYSIEVAVVVKEGSPLDYSLLTYAWVLVISFWAGLANNIEKRRMDPQTPYRLFDTIGDMIVSGFVGVITFWLCQWAEFNEILSGALTGISAHMGTRFLFLAEKLVDAQIQALLKRFRLFWAGEKDESDK